MNDDEKKITVNTISDSERETYLSEEEIQNMKKRRAEMQQEFDRVKDIKMDKVVGDWRLKDDEIKQAFENKTIIADGQNVNEVNHIVEQITKQHELFKTKIIIQDIIQAYKGEITWGSYLQARKLQIADVREHNQRGIINLKNPSESKIDYLLEPPMLDFTAFMIAEALGKLDRKEDDNKDVL